MAWVGKTTCEAMKANDRVPRARLTPPSLVIGRPISNPTAPATVIPTSVAHRKLRRPLVAMNGRSTPQSLVDAQPVANAAAVTKVAWARLTIPPRPVTTTNDKKMIPVARPWAITVWA